MEKYIIKRTRKFRIRGDGAKRESKEFLRHFLQDDKRLNVGQNKKKADNKQSGNRFGIKIGKNGRSRHLQLFHLYY